MEASWPDLALLVAVVSAVVFVIVTIVERRRVPDTPAPPGGPQPPRLTPLQKFCLITGGIASSLYISSWLFG